MMVNIRVAPELMPSALWVEDELYVPTQTFYRYRDGMVMDKVSCNYGSSIICIGVFGTVLPT